MQIPVLSTIVYPCVTGLSKVGRPPFKLALANFRLDKEKADRFRIF